MFAMSTMASFTLRSELPVTPDAFWRGMSMDAVNAELRPFITVQSRLPPRAIKCPPATKRDLISRHDDLTTACGGAWRNPART
jgi:hypothetical protein